MNEDNATNNARKKIDGIEWYVPHYTPALPQQALLSKQILIELPTELQYVERSVLMKQVNTQNFELGPQEGINIPKWIIVAFQQRDRQNSQKLNNDTCYRPPVTSTQFNIGKEEYLDSAILI